MPCYTSEGTGTGILRNTSPGLFNETAIHYLCGMITTPCHWHPFDPMDQTVVVSWNLEWSKRHGLLPPNLELLEHETRRSGKQVHRSHGIIPSAS